MPANDREIAAGPSSTLVGAILEAREALCREFDGFRHLLRQREAPPVPAPTAEVVEAPGPAPRRSMVATSGPAPAPHVAEPPQTPADARQRLDALARLLDQRARPQDPVARPPSVEPAP